MAQSEVTICNDALAMLGQSPIISLNDQTRVAGLCKTFYPLRRDEVLRAHPWRFAVKRASLAANTVEPIYEFAAAYDLPVDCLRVLDVERDHPNVDWRVEARQIVTDQSAPLNITYVAKVTETGLYDSLFCAALSARLAWVLAMPITSSPTTADAMQAAYKAALREARSASAREGKPQTVYADEFLESRF